MCDEETEQTYEWSTIYAMLLAARCLGNGSWEYIFQYDDTQLEEDQLIFQIDIQGVACMGCWSQFVTDIAGEEVLVQYDEETEEVTITTQHGCVTTFPVGGGEGGPCLSEEEGNQIVLDEFGCWYVPPGEGGDGWDLLGNAGTVEGTNFLGTTDNIPFEIRANNARVSKFFPNATAPILVGGNSKNALREATGGGGSPSTLPNTGVWIGGGGAAPGSFTNILDGNLIWDGYFSAIAAGGSNYLEGDGFGLTESSNPPGFSFIGAGYGNVASSYQTTGVNSNTTYRGLNVIGGGFVNKMFAASKAVIVGGNRNLIDGTNPVPGSIPRLFCDTIVGGAFNSILYEVQSDFVDSFTYAHNFIGAGLEHEMWNSGMGTIAGGAENQFGITNTDNVNLGGKLFHLADSIVGGETNCIWIFNQDPEENQYIIGWNQIGGGYNNVMADANACGISSGVYNSIGSIGQVIRPDNDAESTPGDALGPWNGEYIGGGYYNSILHRNVPTSPEYNAPAGFNVIPGGYGNRITNFYGSERYWGSNVIAGGLNNLIASDNGCFIGSGFGNEIQLNADELLSLAMFDAIVCGEQNNISYAGVGAEDPLAGSSFIGTGYLNDIDNNAYSAILNGRENVVTGALSDLFLYNFVGVGLENLIEDSYSSSVINAHNSTHLNSLRCSIGSGGEHVIENEDSSGIFSGYGNAIRASAPSWNWDGEFDPPLDTSGSGNVIAGGIANEIEDGFCTVILGGGFLKAGPAVWGYQSPYSVPYLPDAGPQVDITSFFETAFFGDVDLVIGNVAGQARKLVLYEPNTDLDFSSAQYTSFKARAQAANIEYVMPNVAGAPNDRLTIDTVVGTTVTLKWAA